MSIHFSIIHPLDDREDNSKDNIFIAIDETGGYLAHAYVYAFENHHVSYAWPRNILLVLAVQGCKDNEVLKEALYSACMERANILKNERWPLVSVHLYTGLQQDDEDGLAFFLDRGFKDTDGTLVMEKDLTLFKPRIGCTVKRILHSALELKEEREAFIKRHNRCFVKTLDLGTLDNLCNQPGFAVIQIRDEERLLGEALVYEKEGVGMLESFYVIPEVRGGNTSNILMEQTLQFFCRRNLGKVRLEVWERNKRALFFYSRFGFKLKGGRTEVYPWMELLP